jgi:hypothetical protein
MESVPEGTSFLDIQGEESLEVGTNVQPSDPSKIKFTLAKNITNSASLWHIVLHGSSHFNGGYELKLIGHAPKILGNLRVTVGKAI